MAQHSTTRRDTTRDVGAGGRASVVEALHGLDVLRCAVLTLAETRNS